jgi:phage terminase large subunit-like protein
MTAARREEQKLALAGRDARVESRGNDVTTTTQASWTAEIDLLMAAFNVVAWMSANPATSQPSIFVI